MLVKREMNIADYDAELWQAMEQEKSTSAHRTDRLENYTSPRVMQAQGSQLTNKYAEGYPRANATTAVASMLISLNNWRSIAERTRSALTTLTSSRNLLPANFLCGLHRVAGTKAIPFWRYESGIWRSPDSRFSG